MAVKPKNFWILLLCMLAGLTVGNFTGELCKEVSVLSFINYGESFGLQDPVTIDLGVLLISFKFQLKITLAGIIGLCGGILLYKKI
ncbi:MAG: DUF4321 domain-containing protein [Cellulosilyticaceae bacterium]